MAWNDVSRIRCKMAEVCSQRWDDLAPTEQADVRHCGQCDSQVHRVHSRLDFEARAARGQCVSILVESWPGPPAILNGPALPPWRRRPVWLIVAALALAGMAAYLALAS